MSVSLTTKQAGRNTIYAAWTSTLEDPTFYLYRDGLYIGASRKRTAFIPLALDERMELDVTDDPNDSPLGDFPGVFVLSWEKSEETSYYTVARYVDSAWVTLTTVYDVAKSIFQYITPFLEDGEVHQFRVLPVGTNGNAGTPMDFSALMVRHPDVPTVSYTLDPETGAVTVAEAA